MTDNVEKLAEEMFGRLIEAADLTVDLGEEGVREVVTAALTAAGLEVNKAGSFAQLKIFGDQAHACIADDEPGRHSAWEHPVTLDVTLEDFRNAAALTKEG